MFLENDFYTIFGSSLLVILLFIIVFKFWEGKPATELDKAISLLKVNILMVGFLSIVL